MLYQGRPYTLFQDLPLGTWFRWDYSGLPLALGRWNGASGPFVALGDDRYVAVSDPRAAAMYGPATARVIVCQR